MLEPRPTTGFDEGLWKLAWERTVVYDYAYCGPVSREAAEAHPHAYKASYEYYQLLDKAARGEAP